MNNELSTIQSVKIRLIRQIRERTVLLKTVWYAVTGWTRIFGSSGKLVPVS